MKFGHLFKQTLRNEGFPAEWIDSAISYSQLKKCINRLTNELADVGLDPQTLGTLLRQVEEQNASASNTDVKAFEYRLSGGQNGTKSLANGRRVPFHPKLIFYINDATGDLHRAKLDEETRSKLQTLAVESGITNSRVSDVSDGSETKSIDSDDSTTSLDGSCTRKCTEFRTVEVRLTSDSEFFARLSSELSGLEALQEREEKRMHVEIEGLGKQIARLTNPDHRSSRKFLTVWRQIFQLYVENDIFFGTTEKDHAGHNSQAAAERFQQFANAVAKQGLVDRFKKQENLQALNTFMHINQEILQGLRFGEINRTAMLKILKKFDKQTALGVKSSFPKQIEYPEFSEHLAKAVCAEVNTQILSSIPQLDDYACPMCFELKWRPVRLRCQHVFCIRCLIVMQTNKQDRCPLCREKTVVDANSDNLDLELADFLKRWFPDEVKAKQKYNELMAGVDEYGEVYRDRCSVM